MRAALWLWRMQVSDFLRLCSPTTWLCHFCVHAEKTCVFLFPLVGGFSATHEKRSDGLLDQVSFLSTVLFGMTVPLALLLYAIFLHPVLREVKSEVCCVSCLFFFCCFCCCSFSFSFSSSSFSFFLFLFLFFLFFFFSSFSFFLFLFFFLIFLFLLPFLSFLLLLFSSFSYFRCGHVASVRTSPKHTLWRTGDPSEEDAPAHPRARGQGDP